MSRCRVLEPRTLRSTLPDGVSLVADVYRPAGPGRFPVLLMRQPYGRKIASTVVLAHPSWYASFGYIVVVQDVRGRGDSGGTFQPLRDDAADGAASLAWAADLPGSTGQVACYGFSYHAITALLALAGAGRSGSKRPDALALVMGAWSVREHLAYEGGAFRLGFNLTWACQMAAEQARLANDGPAHHALSRAWGEAHLGPLAARPQVLDTHAHYTHYHAWLADQPETWRAISPDQVLGGDALDVPAMHLGGWADLMLEGTCASHAAFAAAGTAAQYLRIGPWSHLPWGRRVGGIDFGACAGDGLDLELLAFFDHQLKGIGNPVPIRLFDLGRRAWIDLERAPALAARDWFLSSSGRAAASSNDGALVEDPAGEAADTFVHDPWRPAPSIGLHLGEPAGFVDRTAVDDRADVAVYTSAPLRAPLALLGSVEAELFVDADRPAFDLNCTLSVVDAAGVPWAITGGHHRVGPGAKGTSHTVSMRRTCVTVSAGARLRLSVQAAAWPAFAVNPGTGMRPEDAPAAAALPITLRIRHGAAWPSRLRLSLSTHPPE